MDAMPNIESALTSTPDAKSRFPKAPEYVVLPAVQAMATASGILCCCRDARRVWSIPAVAAPQMLRGCAPRMSSAAAEIVSG